VLHARHGASRMISQSAAAAKASWAINSIF
jgi:hypothetical protein